MIRVSPGGRRRAPGDLAARPGQGRRPTGSPSSPTHHVSVSPAAVVRGYPHTGMRSGGSYQACCGGPGSPAVSTLDSERTGGSPPRWSQTGSGRLGVRSGRLGPRHLEGRSSPGPGKRGGGVSGPGRGGGRLPSCLPGRSANAVKRPFRLHRHRKKGTEPGKFSGHVHCISESRGGAARLLLGVLV